MSALAKWNKPRVSEVASDEPDARRFIGTAELVLVSVQIAPDGAGMPAAGRRWFRITKRGAASSVDGAFVDHRSKPDLYPAPAVELDLDGICWIGV